MPAGRKLDFRAIDAHIGARLRQRRVELGISQKRLGEACGLAYQQISKYERGLTASLPASSIASPNLSKSP
jgi:transcriptional regulator with XRE-family HTH domain